MVRRVITIKEGGGRLDWCGGNNLIAFDMKGPDGFYGVYTMEPDGSRIRCLTCDRPGLPSKHKGNPAWDPSCSWILFQAERDEAPAQSGAGRFGRRRPLWTRRGGQLGQRGEGQGNLQQRLDFYGEPGLGLRNDLWVMEVRGGRSWKIASTAGRGGGILHPQFSPRGDKVLWAERLGGGGGPMGKWAIKVASFHAGGGQPRLENIREYRPGQQGKFYETHGFSPDERKIIFTASAPGGGSGLHVFTYDLTSGAYQDLTNTPGEWDEHAHYAPRGDKIVWMSSAGLGMPANPMNLKTDYWIMNADGSNKQRLTYFNDAQSPQYIQGGVAAGDFAWNGTGTRIAAYLIENRQQERSRIVVIDLAGPQ